MRNAKFARTSRPWVDLGQTKPVKMNKGTPSDGHELGNELGNERRLSTQGLVVLNWGAMSAMPIREPGTGWHASFQTGWHYSDSSSSDAVTTLPCANGSPSISWISAGAFHSMIMWARMRASSLCTGGNRRARTARPGGRLDSGIGTSTYYVLRGHPPQ